MGGVADAKPWGSLVYNGKICHVQPVPLTTWTTNVQTNLGGFIAPCDLKIEEILLYVGVAATQAGSLLNLGANADIDAIMADYSLDGVAAGVYRIYPSHAAFVRDEDEAQALKGEYIYFNFEDAGDSADGSLAITAIWTPWYPTPA